MNIRHKHLIELGFRIELAIAFLDYGFAKLNGTMFKNHFENMENMKLSQIDMFHLTWYWFDKNRQFSIFIGMIQIISAILLVLNRTKLIGVLMFIPVISGIVMIDIFCVGEPGLYFRVIYYLLVCLGILYVNRTRLLPLIQYETASNEIKPDKIGNAVLWTLIGLALSFGLEMMVILISRVIK